MDYSAISPEDLVLVCFQTGDESAWAEFVRRFHPLIARVVLRIARHWGEASPQTIDDLIQDTYLKLCADRTNFSRRFKPAHRDAVFGYIKVFTANLVHDYFKASRSQKRDSAVTASIDAVPEHSLGQPTVSSGAALDRTVLVQQVDACLRTLAPGTKGQRDRRIFWLYYRFGLPASEIAALATIGLSTKGVESTILRLSRQIRERLIHGQQTVPPSQGAEKGNQSTESL
jgi:RNA polymerase sigma-70 factor (ECF subfamily)